MTEEEIREIDIIIDTICIKYNVLNKGCAGSLNTLQGALSDYIHTYTRCLGKKKKDIKMILNILER